MLLACGAAPAPCPEESRSPRVVVADAEKHTEPVVASAPVSALAEKHGLAVTRILEAARGKQDAFEKLRQLTDGIGHRLSGSPQLDAALAWAENALTADGHENVRREPVMVPHWERGAESAEILAPSRRPLAILGLGGSVGTPKGGVEGEVLVVRSFDELERAGAAVKDKIVLFDVAMRPHDDEKGSGYGEVAPFRTAGPSRAAKLGAKAVLVRSLATSSLRTPHTGATRFEEGIKPIPAAAISTEEAALLGRLSERGERPRVRLTMGARVLPDAKSANVIGEIRGRERPDEVVLIGAHIDSWDVGQGAHDDGAGCVIVMQALTTIRSLGLVPRRTIRVVLFTNEENGLAGAKAYAKDHAAEIPKHVLGLEADSGGFAPFGLNVEVPKDREEKVLATMRDIALLLDPAGKLRVVAEKSGADLIPLVKEGTIGVGYVTRGDKYFDYHHSEADTLDKVDAKELADGVGVVAALAYVVAEMEERL